VSAKYIGIPGFKIKVDVNLAPINRPNTHGHSPKSLIVLHETVSGDSVGVSDIIAPARYLGAHGLGIHGVVDKEGLVGWSLGGRKAILYHAASGSGNVNTRSIGIEQVSRVMVEESTNFARKKAWMGRKKQLDRVAEICALLHLVDDIPLRYSNGSRPGITSHWDVSRTYGVSGGHWDCWPAHKGGYYPLLYVTFKARQIVARLQV
jgi:hypothetical protein